jgi:hypothetical protein
VHHELLAVAIEHHELADRAVEVPGVVRQFLMIETLGQRYIASDGIVDAVRDWRRSLPLSLLKHHQSHHRFATRNYGVSTTLWDHVFVTMLR